MIHIGLRFLFFTLLYKQSNGHYVSNSSEESMLSVQPWRGHTNRGSVWPLPQFMHTTSDRCRFDTSGAIVQYSKATLHKCEILTEAFRRYGKMIKALQTTNTGNMDSADCTYSNLLVKLLSPCEEYPHQEMEETYILQVTPDEIVLSAGSVWGILRGLETFSQLLYQTDSGAVVLNQTSIVDNPRFAYRGILLDTSRHYLPVDKILENIEAMSYNKFNVFHWHIVDHESYPYVSKSFPDLSAKGAYDQLKVYSHADVHRVIEFARLRGIRVVAEFDTPGHTESWGAGQPNLLTKCYSAKGLPDGTFGPINPTKLFTWTFLEQLFTELRGVFKDDFIHIGGDEVPFACWKSNPDVNLWMKKFNISGNYAKLEEYYINNVLNIMSKLQFKSIVWQEVVDNGCKVTKDTVVEVWKRTDPWGHMAKVTAMGLKTIITAPWYLNRITSGEDWKIHYKFEPLNFNGTASQKRLVIGGEACMWGESVDKTNLTPRLWPRASAVAERLWSSEQVNDPTLAAPRLHEHRCRMLQRGINAEPLHQGYC